MFILKEMVLRLTASTRCCIRQNIIDEQLLMVF